MEPFKVLHLQYKTTAASPAYRLNEAFRENGIQSKLLSLYNELDEVDTNNSLGKKSKWISRVNNKLEGHLKKNMTSKFGIFSYPIIGSNISQLKEVQEADLIYIHWVLNGFLSLQNIEQLVKLNKPILFFMHDMWTITGGCHHSFGCNKYMDHCYNCKFFLQDKNNDLSAREFDKKQKVFSKHDNVHFIAPSKWLYNCAKDSMLTKDKPVFYIPNYLDEKAFKPFKKNIAKKILNFDENKIVIAFGAISIESPYKGWKYLQEALRLLHLDVEHLDIEILIFGSGYQKEIDESIPFKTRFMGFLSDEYATNLMYNAADLFVAPSLAEVFGYVILESLRCGTPVVAFNTGGIPDLIKHKSNGYLANYKDAEDLANGIKYCLDHQVTGYALAQFEAYVVMEQHKNLMQTVIGQDSQF